MAFEFFSISGRSAAVACASFTMALSLSASAQHSGYLFPGQALSGTMNPGFIGPRNDGAEFRDLLDARRDGAFLMGLDANGRPVLLAANPSRLLWSGTVAAGGPSDGISSTLRMQVDGNLVLRTPAGATVWQSGTSHTESWLVVQGDGNAVIYRPTIRWSIGTGAGGHQVGPRWGGVIFEDRRLTSTSAPICSVSMTFCLLVTPDGRFQIVRDLYSRGLAERLSRLRPESQLSLLEDYVAVPAPAPDPNPDPPPPCGWGYICEIPRDAKQTATLNSSRSISRADSAEIKSTVSARAGLVQTNQNVSVIFTSPNSPSPGAYIVFQSDGNLVLYDTNGSPLWASGTNGSQAPRWWHIRDDGTLVLITGASVWATNTVVSQGPPPKLPAYQDMRPGWSLSLPDPNRSLMRYPNNLTFQGFNP